MRLDATLPIPTFVGACERLRASALPVTSRDWFCQASPWTTHASYAMALLLVAVGAVLPCAILASTGRRLSALVPLAVAPLLGFPGFFGMNWWGAASSEQGPLLTTLVDTVLNAAVVAIPVVAISFAARRPDARRSHPGLVPAIGVGFVCSLASAGFVFLARSMAARHWGSIGGGVDTPGLLPAALCIAAFALLLGIDRRWWPWSIAPVALLLSGALSVVLLRGPERWTDLSRFGLVAPLAAIGLVWSVWRPASTWLSTRLDRTERLAPQAERSKHPAGPAAAVTAPRVRPIAVLDAIAVALIAISLVAFRTDPILAQLNTNLPTYLGVRVRAQDVRTKLDLRQAIAAMDSYATAHGGYRGFDAVAGRRADPSLAWIDGHRAADGSGHVPALTMSIESASANSARVAALSFNGDAFCLQRTTGGVLTYGRSMAAGGGAATIGRAIESCGSIPWSREAVSMPDVTHLCDGLGPADGYVLCRMVQVLVVSTMKQTKPT
jgi:hypothetical protein